MADNAKPNNSFWSGVNDFFTRLRNTDTLRMGSQGGISTIDSPKEKDNRLDKNKLQVFTQYLQSKNWNRRFTEFYDEYRRMDSTYPIIKAALDIMGEESCLAGSTKIHINGGIKTIKELVDSKQTGARVVKYWETKISKTNWGSTMGIVSKGVKEVYEISFKKSSGNDTTIFSIKATPDHLLMDENKNFKQLKDFKISDKLFAYVTEEDPGCMCKIDSRIDVTVVSINPAGSEEVFDLINCEPNPYFSVYLSDELAITSHNCTKDTDGTIFKVVTEDKKVKAELEKLYFDTLKLDRRAFLVNRSMMKFGNVFAFLQARKGTGVSDMIFLPPEQLKIELLPDNNDPFNFRYQWFGGGGGAFFEPWEIVHWKNIEDIEQEPYGVSALRCIIETWRRVELMREALIIYRVTRAPQRFLFKIATGGLQGEEATRYAQEFKKSVKRKALTNPQTGEIDFKFNMLDITEDFFMPTYEGDPSAVDVLEGASNLDAIEDYKIIKDDIFAGLKIPKAWLTFDEDLCITEDTLIRTNNGTMTPVQISEKLMNGEKVYALAINSLGAPTIGNVSWCGITKKTNILYHVFLSNGKTVKTTGNHPFMLNDNTYKAAEDLQVNFKLKSLFEDKEVVVVDVQKVIYEHDHEVWDLTVDDYHNFGVDSGVYIHNSTKAGLSSEDIRFGRTTQRIQTQFIDGLLHIGLVHLYMLGFNKDEITSFEIEMNNSSTPAEKMKFELLDQKITTAKNAWDPNNQGLNLMSFTDVLKNYLNFTDEEVEQTIKRQLIEKKLNWRLKQIDENGFYNEPLSDKKQDAMAGMNDVDPTDIFANIKLEGKTLTEIVKNKIDEEIKALFPPTKIQAKKETKKIVYLTEHMSLSNIDRTAADLGLDTTGNSENILL